MKKIISIIVMIICILSISCAFAVEFSDVPASHWAYDVIHKMYENKVLNGYEDGTFKPDKPITRAEFATILVRSLNLDIDNVSNDIVLEDVGEDHWAYKYIMVAQNYLYPYETEDNRYLFMPDNLVLREDVAVATVLASGLDNKDYDLSNIDYYTDGNEVSDNLRQFVSIAIDYGIMNGNEDRTFNPKGNLTRAQVAQLIKNVTMVTDFEFIATIIPTNYDDNGLFYELEYDGTTNLSPAIKYEIEEIGEIDYSTLYDGFTKEDGKTNTSNINDEFEDFNDFDSFAPIDDNSYELEYDSSIHAHNFKNAGVLTQATCTTTGIQIQKCSICGASRQVKIKKVGHDFGQATVVRTATCGMTGIESRTCLRCGIVERKTLPKLANHKWGSYVTTKSATCGIDGTRIRVCQVCGTQETSIIPKNSNHKWGAWKVTSADELSKTETRTCSNCGMIESKVYDMALGEYTFTSNMYIVSSYPTSIKDGEDVTFIANRDITVNDKIELYTNDIQTLDIRVEDDKIIADGSSIIATYVTSLPVEDRYKEVKTDVKVTIYNNDNEIQSFIINIEKPEELEFDVEENNTAFSLGRGNGISLEEAEYEISLTK